MSVWDGIPREEQISLLGTQDLWGSQALLVCLSVCLSVCLPASPMLERHLAQSIATHFDLS